MKRDSEARTEAGHARRHVDGVFDHDGTWPHHHDADTSEPVWWEGPMPARSTVPDRDDEGPMLVEDVGAELRECLDAIDGIVDDTHPEGDGCPLCNELDALRIVVDRAFPEGAGR